MFGDVLPVLQHHSNYSYDGNTEEEKKTVEKLKRTCENWDAPLIITTSVQFFNPYTIIKAQHCESSTISVTA